MRGVIKIALVAIVWFSPVFGFAQDRIGRSIVEEILIEAIEKGRLDGDYGKYGSYVDDSRFEKEGVLRVSNWTIVKDSMVQGGMNRILGAGNNGGTCEPMPVLESAIKDGELTTLKTYHYSITLIRLKIGDGRKLVEIARENGCISAIRLYQYSD